MAATQAAIWIARHCDAATGGGGGLPAGPARSVRGSQRAHHVAAANNLLANVLYTGQLRVDPILYPGENEAIIDQETLDLVQARIKENSVCGEKRGRTRMAVASENLKRSGRSGFEK